MNACFGSVVKPLVHTPRGGVAFQASYLLYLQGCRMDLELEEGAEKLRAWGALEQLLKGGSCASDPSAELRSMFQRLGSTAAGDLVCRL
jgi:hypothetical protein